MKSKPATESTLLSAIFFVSLSIFSWSPTLLFAQPLVADDTTTLLLKFDNVVSPTVGAPPLSSIGLNFQEGVHGQAAYFGEGSILEFDNQPGLPTAAGTIEFWVKPAWIRGAAVDRDFVWWGDMIGSFNFRHYADWLLATFNAMTTQGYTIWAGHNDALNPTEWNHVAITWSSDLVRIYLNGKKLREEIPPFPFVPPENGSLRIGGSLSAGPLDAAIDEFRVSDRARTDNEIFQSYFAGLANRVEGLVIQLPTSNFHPEWHLMPRVSAQIGSQSVPVPPSTMSWSSSSPAVAEVRADGRIHAKSAGSAELAASIGEHLTSVTINVTAPKLAPVFETIDPLLAEPAADAEVIMPVVILRFLPTQDGVMLDDRSAPDFWSLNPVSLDYMRNRILEFDGRIKFAVEEATRFRGYKRPHAKAYLGYKVVAYITVYEVTPPRFSDRKTNGFDVYYHDFHSIFERFDLAKYINDLGVREVWVWDCPLDPEYPSFDPDYNIAEHARFNWESNMSSPLMADISNSNRDTSDLPILEHTYIVYGQNMRRSQAEALHNRGHQFEAMFGYAAWLQDQRSDYNFFWNNFVGREGADQLIMGRAGWTHMPPNTLTGYDTTNTNLVESDIEDWRPDNSGQKKMVNVNTWASIDYGWPGAMDFQQKDETHWYVYWFQNFPGHWSNIPYEQDAQVSNWWEFVADWDKAMNAKLGLYRPRSEPTYSEWRAAHGLPETPGHDRDVDGLPLLVKYAAGTNPGRQLSSALKRSGNTWFLEFDRLATAADVSFGAATSTQLGSANWNSPIGEEILDSSTDLHRVRVAIPSMHGRGFARLLATPVRSSGSPHVSALPVGKSTRTAAPDTRTQLPPMPEHLAPDCSLCKQQWRHHSP
jgi:hypothetical protein